MSYATDLAFALTDIGETITYSGTDYTAIVASPISNLRSNQALEGYDELQETEIVIRLSDFNPAPADQITLRSKVYDITRIEVDEGNVAAAVFLRGE